MGNASIRAEACGDCAVFHLTEVLDMQRVKARIVRVSIDPSKRKKPRMPSEVVGSYDCTEAFWIDSLQAWICFNLFQSKPDFYDWNRGYTLAREHYQGPYRIPWTPPTKAELQEAGENNTLPHRSIGCYAMSRLLRLNPPITT